MQDKTNIIEPLLREAGALVQHYFGASFANMGAQSKQDGSPVTLADRQAEQLIRRGLRAAFPHDAILGEEEEDQDGTSGQTWIIDPIDGTRNFISHNPLFGTLLGLHDGAGMRLGMAYLPMLDQLWCAEATGKAMCNNRPLHSAETVDITAAVISTTAPDLFDTEGLQRWQNLSSKVASRRYGGDCTQYLFLASGGLDLVYEEGLKPYDILPLLPIIEAAGGVVTDRHGRCLHRTSVSAIDGSCLAAANAHLHAQALALLR